MGVFTTSWLGRNCHGMSGLSYLGMAYGPIQRPVPLQMKEVLTPNMEHGLHISYTTISYVGKFSHLASNCVCQLTGRKIVPWVNGSLTHRVTEGVWSLFCSCCLCFNLAVSALKVLVWWRKGHPVCKKTVWWYLVLVIWLAFCTF